MIYDNFLLYTYMLNIRGSLWIGVSYIIDSDLHVSMDEVGVGDDIRDDALAHHSLKKGEAFLQFPTPNEVVEFVIALKGVKATHNVLIIFSHR